VKNVIQRYREHFRARERMLEERGQVLAWTALLLPVLLVLVGLVFDGGLMWAQYRRARWAADGAAVAAASEINPVVYAQSGQVKLDPAKAIGTVVYYGQGNNPNLHLGAIYLQNNTVRVQGWVEIKPVFLGLFGVGSLRLNVTGRERPAWGIARPGQ
jgi:hypothetical protein